MIVSIKVQDKIFQCDLAKPIDLSITLRHGVQNPNCYYSPPPEFNPIVQGNFVGSLKSGSPVNHYQMIITPHGNGTHTECYGHIVDENGATISENFKKSHLIAELITVLPEKNKDGDLIVTLERFAEQLDFETEAVILRTWVDPSENLSKNYSGSNPAYLEDKIGYYLLEKGIKHLLVDLPSVDKEVDGGKLLTHKAFWGLPNDVRKDSTITEMIHVSNRVSDGLYLLDLQVLNVELDVSPSRPIIFKLG